MKKYLVYNKGEQYRFVFYNIETACDFMWEVDADCIVNAETGEIVVERL